MIRRFHDLVLPHAIAPGSARPPRQNAAGFVGFVTGIQQPQFLTPGGVLIADQASVRLRVGIPAQYLQRYAPICLIPLSFVEQPSALRTLGEPRAIVVGKFPARTIVARRGQFAALLDWIEDARTRHPIVADLSDDLAAAAEMFQVSWLAEFQQRLARSCPLSVPCAALRDRVAGDAAHGVTVIEDPYERSPAAPARFAPGETLRLAWYGVFGNVLRPLVEGRFADIARRLAPRPVEIAFITNAGHANLVNDMAAHLRGIHPGCRLRMIPWSTETVAREVSAADLVVLPQDTGGEWGSVKSHNRLVEALRGGRLAIVSPIPSYRELADWAWVGEDLSEGVAWALANPAEVLQRITGGQAVVAERFSPQRIGEKWASLLGLG